jgi:aminoglycoside phosphotransferase (APT) family kinase protein
MKPPAAATARGAGGGDRDRTTSIAAWYEHTHPDAGPVAVTLTDQIGQGYSNEVLFATVTRHDGERLADIVVRLPPSGPPLFPDYDLRMQAAVQDVAAAAGVPVPRPVEVEPDPSWLGAPFLVMPRIEGRHPGEVPTTCDWLVAASPDQQRTLQTSFLDALAALHTAPFAGTEAAGLLRGGSLVDEVRWWTEFAEWACEGAPAGALVDLFDWCAAHLPSAEPARSVLWGDVRLGNVVAGDDYRPVAILDWEMATIGPAESDLAWYTALSGMIERFFGETLPGFLGRDGIIAHHEAALGRPLQDMAWHELFAMARSAAAGHRTQVVAALAEGAPLPDPAASPVLQYTQRRMAKH